ncbi:MAG: hypothetical protein WBH82_07660 [Arcanobacterium sp.]
MAGAALEQLSHLEVLLRNAIDNQLASYCQEETVKIPWFLLEPYYSAQSQIIKEVRDRLRKTGDDSRDQIVAGVSFGFWTGWFGPKYEELWRKSLRLAFPNGSGLRKEISVLVEQLRKFRNRIAHHDSLLNIDIGFEMNSVFKLAEIINPDAATWMRSIDRTREVAIAKPVDTIDTVIVPAANAWGFYQRHRAYVCQPGRYFQKVQSIAFYSDRRIQPVIPQIKNRYDNVRCNLAEARRLQASSSRDERKLGQAIQAVLDEGWDTGTYQFFILSGPDDPASVALKNELTNTRTGRSSAFVRKQRYTSIHQLHHAQDIWDL